jgi:hypothetical protein
VKPVDPLVRVEHCIGVDGRRYCAPGLRAFFTRHGLDLRTFIRGGLPASVIEGTGDAMAIRAAAVAREDAMRGDA